MIFCYTVSATNKQLWRRYFIWHVFIPLPFVKGIPPLIFACSLKIFSMKKHQCALCILRLSLGMISWWLQNWFGAPFKSYEIRRLSCCRFHIAVHRKGKKNVFLGFVVLHFLVEGCSMLGVFLWVSDHDYVQIILFRNILI